MGVVESGRCGGLTTPPPRMGDLLFETRCVLLLLGVGVVDPGGASEGVGGGPYPPGGGGGGPP